MAASLTRAHSPNELTDPRVPPPSESNEPTVDERALSFGRRDVPLPSESNEPVDERALSLGVSTCGAGRRDDGAIPTFMQ